MKLNWGNALLIFFIAYVGILIFVVFKSTTIDHSLVVEDYYDHDVAYQEKLDKLNNRKLLQQDLGIKYSARDNKIDFDFGESSSVVDAKVQMYRPSNKGADFVRDLKPQNQKAQMNLPRMENGKWTVKVEWSDNVRSYYKEEDIYVSQL